MKKIPKPVIVIGGGLLLFWGYSQYKKSQKTPTANVNGQPVTKGSKPVAAWITTAIADIPAGVKAYNSIAKAFGSKMVDDTGSVALDYDSDGNPILDGSGAYASDSQALDFDENGNPIWDSAAPSDTVIDYTAPFGGDSDPMNELITPLDGGDSSPFISVA